MGTTPYRRDSKPKCFEMLAIFLTVQYIALVVATKWGVELAPHGLNCFQKIHLFTSPQISAAWFVCDIFLAEDEL